MRTKPSVLRLNESHPLASGLVVASIPNGQTGVFVGDYSRGQRTNAGTFLPLDGAWGSVAGGQNTSFRSVRYTFPQITIGPGLCFALAIDRWNTTANSDDRFAASVGTSAGGNILLGFDAFGSTSASGPSGSTIRGFLRDAASGGPGGFGGAAGLRNNGPHVLICNSSAANSHQYIVNGIVNATSAASMAAVAVNQFSLLSAFRNTDALQWSGGVAGGWLWNRSLSANEISELSADPFAMFRPRQRSYFYAGIAAGGPTYTLTADAGTFTLTGIATNLLASRRVSADLGTFALSGIDAGLLASRQIAAATGTFILTGIDAELTYTPSDTPLIDSLFVTRTAAATIRFTGTTDGNRVQYYIQAAPGTTPDESDTPTGEVTVTRNIAFDFNVEGVDVGSIRVHARAAHRGNVGSWAAL